MINSNQFKAKIIEKGYNMTTLSKEMNISKTTLSLKVNNKIKFSQPDIKKISEILNLTAIEIYNIFFNK